MNPFSSTTAMRPAHPLVSITNPEASRGGHRAQPAHADVHLSPVSDGMVVLAAFAALAVITLVAICAGPLAGTTSAWHICTGAGLVVVAITARTIRHNHRLRSSRQTLQYVDAVLAQRGLANAQAARP